MAAALATLKDKVARGHDCKIRDCRLDAFVLIRVCRGNSRECTCSRAHGPAELAERAELARVAAREGLRCGAGSVEARQCRSWGLAYLEGVRSRCWRSRRRSPARSGLRLAKDARAAKGGLHCSRSSRITGALSHSRRRRHSSTGSLAASTGSTAMGNGHTRATETEGNGHQANGARG